jgi:hypothetical protein
MRLFIRSEEIVGRDCNWWGSMPCDLFSNPILTEKTLVQLGCNAFRLKDVEASVAKSSRELTLWDPYISCAKSNPLRTLKQMPTMRLLRRSRRFRAGKE